MYINKHTLLCKETSDVTNSRFKIHLGRIFLYYLPLSFVTVSVTDEVVFVLGISADTDNLLLELYFYFKHFLSIWYCQLAYFLFFANKHADLKNSVVSKVIKSSTC